MNDLLDTQAVNEAEALGLHARQVVEGYIVGEHKSPFHGFSIEFSQHREYVPGDDLRHLDWKVLGRSDRYYIKQYEQETNYVAHLAIDGSESMTYRSNRVSKLAYAKQLAAVLCYVILGQRDAVSLTLFDEAVQAFVPRTGSLGSMNGILQTLARFEPTKGTHIAPVLHQIARMNPRRGIVILVSDCFDDEEAILAGLQHLRYAGHEVILMHTLDRHEIEFPLKGNVEFLGYENTGRQTAKPNEIRASYLKNFNAFVDRLKTGCERNKIHYLQVVTDTPLHETMTGYLAFRQRTTTK